VKWWFPARWFGIHHKSSFFDSMTDDDRRERKRRRATRDGLHPMLGRQAQPRYERIVKLAPMRYGLTVRREDGSQVVHEIIGPPRVNPSR
jgi:hypothetical protein